MPGTGLSQQLGLNKGMDSEKRSQELRSIARFQITKSQWLIASLALISIISLGVSSLIQSNSTVKQSSLLSNVETPAASIIFTQRETLVYATRLAQWSNGGTTRRSVQIARSLLAQRLAVVDTSGRSMGSRAQNSYWDVLKKSDEIVAKAPVGVLPESVHMEFSREISPIIDQILAEARKLVVSYQRFIDAESKQNLKDVARRDQISLILFYLSLFFSGLFLLLNVLTNFKNYRIAGRHLVAEQRRLDKIIKELQIAKSTVIELQNLSDSKNAFIATVNHELRTPLTSIIGYIDIIREEEASRNSSHLNQYLNTLDRNAQILLNLVESMLTLSKIDGGRTEIVKEMVWINEVIDNAIFTMKPQANNAGISITFDADDEFYVEGDSGQLLQVFINLIGNAVKFSPKNSAVNIKVRAATNSENLEVVRVTIEDFGIGIPAADIEHLFTRFFRANNAVTDHFQGTGLGLSIVSQVLERHEGSISLSSVEGEGTTFNVDIPRQLTSEDKLIRVRRGEVLDRAIAAIEASTPSTLCAITHEMGGALGFYGFIGPGKELIDYSRTLSESEILGDEEFEASRRRYLELLKSERERGERVE
jgi:signal transduction histidine kinase